MSNRATFRNTAVSYIKNKMISRNRRILNMVLAESSSSVQSHKQDTDLGLSVTEENYLQKSHNYSSFTYEPTPTALHDASSDTNSIPDSQPAFDLDFSLDEINKNDTSYLEKPNKIVENSCSDSDNDTSSSSDSDSTKSTIDDFSSDDSVKDPDYHINSSNDSDSDNDWTTPITTPKTHFFSRKPKTSEVLSTHPLSTDNIDMEARSSEKHPCNVANYPAVNIQSTNVDIQPSSAGTQSPSVIDSPVTIDTQPPSVIAQPSSVDTRPSSVDAVSPCVNTDLQHGFRKRKAKPESWKKNQAKLLKNSGKAYTSLSKSKKLCDAKKMGPVCADKCKLKCSAKFTDEERLSIFQAYWATADLHIQRQFVHEHMSKITPKYRYTRDGSNRKNLNKAYYLPHNETRLRVCKIFFMHTLAISDKFIRTVEKKHSNPVGTQTKDERGTHGSHNKTDTDMINNIKAHISSIPRIESHYCRAQTKREYIEGGTNVATLHRDYVQKCKSEEKSFASYQIYYNIFKTEFNISFWQPKKDQCEDCTAYHNAEDKVLLQSKYELHLKEKTLARAEKERDKQNVNDNFIVAVYDLQAVMPCPRGEVSSFYYISKINLLNFTITELETKNTICFVWHEGEGARGVNELGSCVYMYLKSLHDKANEVFDVVFYSDNCCGQQKNKFMLAMYQHALREFPKIRSITHKYLIKGHTQNEGDSVHSIIGKNISNALKSSPIYVPDQYITLIKTAKKKGTPYTVKELAHDSFYDLKPLAVGNYTVTEDGDRLRWTDIKVIKIDQETPNKFFFKTSYEDAEFKSVYTLTKKQARTNNIITTTLKKLYAQKLKVSETKKQGILSLIEKNVIPKYYEAFYANL